MAAPVIGKVNRGLFERVIFPNLGAEDASVIVGRRLRGREGR